METDASEVGIGVVLSQERHPIAFVSKALGPRTRGLSTYEKEWLAILLVVDHWRQYLQFSEFLILTNHHSLMHLTDQRLHTPWQQKAYTKLLGLQYKICYRKGQSNGAADALSRKFPDEYTETCAISSYVPVWMQDIIYGYQQDQESSQLIAALSINPNAKEHFKLQDGILKYKGRIWLGSNQTLISQVISALHASPMGGHSGFPVTYSRIKSLFAWPSMKKSILAIVKSCQICLQAKLDISKYPGLLQPLPVPTGAWQTISMDFIEGLPRSEHFDCILVVVDKFSKYAHFLPLAHPFTASSVAKVFMQNVYKLHGLPKVIISDRDKIFTNEFWDQLFTKSGTQLHLSSAYHPQTDGQTERVNQCLEIYLRCFVHAAPSKWVPWLYLAEFWYNSSYHSTLNKTPFEVLYGYPPTHFGIGIDSCSIPELDKWLSERKFMTQLLQQHLNRAQQQMKSLADKKRSFRSFEVGGWVYLKLQPYVQTSVSKRANHKLSFRYFGPFQVLHKIGSVANRLQLSLESLIHHVFHVSQLRGTNDFVPAAVSNLPPALGQFSTPEAILDTRVVKKGNSVVSQVLVKWSNCPIADATWEDREDLRARFPLALAWGQASFQGISIVSSADENASKEDDEEQDLADAKEEEPRRSKRSKHSNPNFYGPEWAV